MDQDEAGVRPSVVAVDGRAGGASFRAQYVKHVSDQMTSFSLSGAGGGEQVLLASQDRTGSDVQTRSLAVLVLPPGPGHDLYRVSDNGYVASVVGLAALRGTAVRDLLEWHVVEVDPSTGHLVAPVDDPSLVGGRMHDLEQAMTDVLRHATVGGRLAAAVTDAVDAHDLRARQAAADLALLRLTRSRAGRVTAFADDCAQVVAHLHALLPALTWSVVMLDGEGVMSPLTVAGTSYPDLAGVSAPWEDTVCAAQARGLGPTAAPNLMDVPAYAAAPATRLGFEGCYLGSTLRCYDGTVVGALCGLAPDPQPVDEITAHATTVELLATLLSRTWDAYDLLSRSGMLPDGSADGADQPG